MKREPRSDADPADEGAAPAGADRVGDLERKVEERDRTIAELARRLDALAEEVSRGAPAAPPPRSAPAAPDLATAAAGLDLVDRPAEPTAKEAAAPADARVATVVGRTFIVLGGAFLLRALTQRSQDSGDFGQLGVAVGMAYAAVWLVLADRAGKAGRVLDASAHGMATAIIAFPLIWEATTRFEVLPAPGAAAALLGFGGALLAGAWRRDLPALAWIGAFFALSTGAVLFLSLESEWSLLAAVLVLAAAALWLAQHARWPGLRWPLALVLDLLALAALAVGGGPGYEWLQPDVLAVVTLSITGLFLLSFAGTTLIARAPAGVFETVQALVVVEVGYRGSLWALQDSAGVCRMLAIGALATGALCVAIALLVLDRRRDQEVNAGSYTALATLLLIEGPSRLLPAQSCAMVWAALAVLAAWPAGAERRWVLRLAVAAFPVTAAVASGMAVRPAPALTHEVIVARTASRSAQRTMATANTRSKKTSNHSSLSVSRSRSRDGRGGASSLLIAACAPGTRGSPR